MLDLDFLKSFTEVPSVGTACMPAIYMMANRFGTGYAFHFVTDGFCLFHKAGYTPESLHTVFVAHLDEIGGCVYGARPEGGYHSRVWGNRPSIFAYSPLQAFDYLEGDGSNTFEILGDVVRVEDENRLVVFGENLRPYRTVFTFRQETTFEGDTIRGKALDPRVTAFAVAEAVLALNDPRVGALFVLAEECAMDVARKAVHFLDFNAPNLRQIVNVDVPGIQNLGEGRLDLPAIRIFEGRNFIDPSYGIRVAEALEKKQVAFHLSAARSGSQTLLFTPLAPTLSIALPSEGVHLPSVAMSLLGTERCITLLKAIAELQLNSHAS